MGPRDPTEAEACRVCDPEDGNNNNLKLEPSFPVKCTL